LKAILYPQRIFDGVFRKDKVLEQLQDPADISFGGKGAERARIFRVQRFEKTGETFRQPRRVCPHRLEDLAGTGRFPGGSLQQDQCEKGV
jgi:hypothetical protein